MSEEINNTQERQPVENTGMTLKQKLRIVIITLLLILLVTFVVQNSNRVEIEFLNMDFNIRIIFIILGSALVGALLTFLLMKHRARKRKK